MLINKINSIGSIPVFKSDYYDRVKRIERNSSIFSSDYWNAEEIVERNMRSEIYDLERKIAQKETELRCREQAERDAKSSHNSILSSKRSRLSNIKEQTSYNERTVIPGINRTLSSLGTQTSQLKNANYSARSAISQQESSIEELKAEISNLKTRNKEFQEELTKDTEKKISIIKREYEQKLEKLKANVNDSIKKADTVTQDIYMPKPLGFGKISGFADVKKSIASVLGQIIIMEQNGKSVDVPNGILLYGPDAKNNKVLAESIAQQFNTQLISVTLEGNDIERFNSIKEATNVAKRNYQEGLGRTLIVIDKFEKFAPKNSRIIGPLKSLFDTISKDSHATIVATTESPELLDDILLRSGRFESKIAVHTMSTNDILSNIKRYLPLELVDNIDLSVLTQMIEKTKQNGAFSVNQLKTFITSLKHINQIKDLIVDIKPEQLTKFKQQIEFMKHI